MGLDKLPGRSYFRTEPYVGSGDPGYFGPSQRVAATYCWFHHELSVVIGDSLAQGLTLERCEELEHDVSTVFASFGGAGPLPLSWVPIARKPA